MAGSSVGGGNAGRAQRGGNSGGWPRLPLRGRPSGACTCAGRQHQAKSGTTTAEMTRPPIAQISAMNRNLLPGPYGARGRRTMRQKAAGARHARCGMRASLRRQSYKQPTSTTFHVWGRWPAILTGSWRIRPAGYSGGAVRAFRRGGGRDSRRPFRPGYQITGLRGDPVALKSGGSIILSRAPSAENATPCHGHFCGRAVRHVAAALFWHISRIVRAAVARPAARRTRRARAMRGEGDMAETVIRPGHMLRKNASLRAAVAFLSAAAGLPGSAFAQAYDSVDGNGENMRSLSDDILCCGGVH